MIPTSVSLEVMQKTPAGLGIFKHILIDVLAWNHPEAEEKAWEKVVAMGLVPVQVKNVSSTW